MKMNIGNLSHEADSYGDDFAAIFGDYFSPLANEKNPSESVSPEGTPRDAAVFGQSTEAVDESPNPSINPTIDIPNNLAGLYQALFQQLLEFMSLGTLMALNPGLMPARMIPIQVLYSTTPPILPTRQCISSPLSMQVPIQPQPAPVLVARKLMLQSSHHQLMLLLQKG
ncbi:hypothetical protein SEMRO_1716_G293130.1 [Seminavis robusta]|uniref:Uncharacterized protein n=1 Tax=Seminavis robusta TaxID=568900 RepID=A0A9N8ER23_9STRA|nr:hypothetical protein SEMRO_1716_G293130.1 [Seminavis robusta]|eukprot:Sro1716_g293130.1 n/a (169) ;mRNA; r:1134-1640